MTTEAEGRQFEFKQAIIELLWSDDTPQAAARVVALCTSNEERDHALWMAVALQRTSAVSALLQAGVSTPAREAALSLVCGGLVRIGQADTRTHPTEWGSARVSIVETPVRVGTSRFWFEAENLMTIYLEQGRIKGNWLAMLPALREGVAPDGLEKSIETLQQANSRDIHVAMALLRTEIARQAMPGGTGEVQPEGVAGQVE